MSLAVVAMMVAVVLQELRKRKPQMDGALSGMRGVEYHGGTDRGDRKAVT